MCLYFPNETALLLCKFVFVHITFPLSLSLRARIPLPQNSEKIKKTRHLTSPSRAHGSSQIDNNSMKKTARKTVKHKWRWISVEDPFPLVRAFHLWVTFWTPACGWRWAQLNPSVQFLPRRSWGALSLSVAVWGRERRADVPCLPAFNPDSGL